MNYILVVSDCEPDDYFAILCLLRFTPDIHVKFLINCWTDVVTKAKIFKKLIGDYEVYYGEPSTKQYDMTTLVEQFKPDDIEVSKYSDDLFENASEIYCFAPPVEMITAYRKNPKIFNGKTCYLYGSFNIRTLSFTYDEKQPAYEFDEIIMMFKSFETVFWYETMIATGLNNSLTDQKLFDCVYREFPAFETIVNWWNGLIKAEHMKTLKLREEKLVNEQDPDKQIKLRSGMDKNRKVISNIEKCPEQIVNADCGLVIYILYGNKYINAERVDIGVDPKTGFTFGVPNENSQIFLVKHLNFGSEDSEYYASFARQEQLEHYRELWL